MCSTIGLQFHKYEREIMDIAQFLKPQYLWIIGGFVLILLELALPGLTLLFFGMGALLVGILSWIFDISLNIQLTIFLITSIFTLLTLRNSFKKLFNKALKAENVPSDFGEFVGQRAVVVEDIPDNGIGKVEFRGTRGEAEACAPISKGVSVNISTNKNITLIVETI